MMLPTFKDHFSGVADAYAGARPDYPDALFDWIASVAPAQSLAWEAGCGSGQATRGLAKRFARVHAADPSAGQIAHAQAPANAVFAIEPAECTALPDASADVACVAQALHWFDRDAYFAECARVLRPGGVLVAWGYQDIVMDEGLREAVDGFAADIRPYWPPERADVDAAYAGYAWPFPAIDAPQGTLSADWPLARLLAYFSSYSATRRCREATGRDPVAAHADAIARAWGAPATLRRVQWPLFVHARRAP
ncbi:class I SAM-dependent methyltransferase [Luteimonas kalidii]|uniref:Class I SAM-dependent methyltransferase n=1 Tax=Luteimonas kalidii TaxID=3042025 RepID=A0ABT6JQQ2_9GAMM|nr:class I SAM-dependent methyltransferase [Luteimonas kalidii]MDH5833000.1 class I SAM-dependent methyltransferase [Luteimonas kalidii]